MKLGKISGIDLRIHPSFWFLVAIVAFGGLNGGLGLGGTLVELAFIGALFAAVALHELGHAFAARRYGIPTRSITLSILGGLARLERMPERPAQELVIALAGPAVNVVLGGVSGLLLLAVDSAFLTRFAVANAVLVAFNLLPAFPMDGGRVLRALLAMRLSFPRATRVAVTVGRGMVVPFAVAGVFWNPVLLLIGAFVWFAAGAELRMAQERGGLDGARVLHASMGKLLFLQADDRLSEAVELTLDGSQKDFPVVNQVEVIGSLTQRDLLQAVKRRGLEARVADVMQPCPPSVEAEGPLTEAVTLMRESSSPFVVVTKDREPVGLMTMENVAEFLRFRRAMRGRMPIRLGGIVEQKAAETSPALLN